MARKKVTPGPLAMAIAGAAPDGRQLQTDKPQGCKRQAASLTGRDNCT